MELDIGQLQNDTLYAVRTVRVEEDGSDYIKVEHKHGDGSYSKSWDGLLQNLETSKHCFHLINAQGGGHSGHTHTGGQSKKFSGNPKISLHFQCNPKISAHLIYINLYMNIKYPQTMQVRIASIEPRNINITMFGIKKYHEHSFSFLWTEKYHFRQYSDPKISDLPPRMCMCRVPSLGSKM